MTYTSSRLVSAKWFPGVSRPSSCKPTRMGLAKSAVCECGGLAEERDWKVGYWNVHQRQTNHLFISLNIIKTAIINGHVVHESKDAAG